MAYPRAWTEKQPTSESWWIENADRSGGPSVLGSEQIVSSPAGRWRARLTFQCIREEILEIRALIMALRGRAGTLRIGPFDLIGAPKPGTSDVWAFDLGIVDQPNVVLPIAGAAPGHLVGPHDLMDTEIVVRMQGGRVPTAGIYAEIGGFLHALTSVVHVEGSDTDFRCEVEPWLRADMPSGTPVEFDAPTLVMRCLTPVSDLTVQGGSHLTQITLDLVEDLSA